MTNTITMWGNATGYGGVSGSESFVLNGYLNTVLLEGANDTVSLASGGDDSIDLNATGFTNAVTDVIDLGQGLLDSITSSNALYGANLSIGNGYGVTSVSLVNHGGSTSLSLGNDGATVNQFGLGINDNLSLNGDATNNVSFTSGSGADISIGAAGDAYYGYASDVSLYGVYDELFGGDEAFSVAGNAGLSLVELGNGDDSLPLGGQKNTVILGNGNDNVTFADGSSTLHIGTGSDNVATGAGRNHLIFATGGAGSIDTIDLHGGGNVVDGGNENFTIAGTASASVHLGDGNNCVTLLHGLVDIGSGTGNTACNSVDIARGGDKVVLNGGIDQLSLHDIAVGDDNVVLNGTMLGTQLSAAGSFDSIVLSADANAAICETGGAQGLSLTFYGDAHMGMGTVSVTGLAQDLLAHITLAGMSSYYVTPDNTPAGGLTLHFTQGSLDLIGLQSISNSLITVVPGH
jgi:hypothetical protein